MSDQANGMERVDKLLVMGFSVRRQDSFFLRNTYAEWKMVVQNMSLRELFDGVGREKAKIDSVKTTGEVLKHR